MSYWYEPKKEDMELVKKGDRFQKQKEDEIHIWLDDKPVYDDCGNVYVSLKVKDIQEVLKALKERE